MSDNIDGIICEIRKSKKYSNINEDVLTRVCTDASDKYRKVKDAVKAAKTELHIINESYLLNDCHSKAKEIISSYNDTNPFGDRNLSNSLLTLHASSKERLEHIGEIYSFLSDYIDATTVLGDIGCGFAPFALSYLDRIPEVYRAYEMNNETVDVLNMYFNLSDNIEYRAYPLDAVSNTPKDKFDTVFLFKLLPVLEQQKKGRALSILDELDFKTAVVSFPLKSLSGREKGMQTHYSDFFENLADGKFKILKKEVVFNELFYILNKID